MKAINSCACVPILGDWILIVSMMLSIERAL
nr:MAG TPA: hypothetical protein [Caudoviricetes sp.]